MAILQHIWPKYTINELITFSLSALLLTIPLSSSGKSIFVGLALILILCSRDRRMQLKGIVAERWCQSILALFFLVLLACWWSPASFNAKLFVLEKYSKWFYLPIFLVGFRNKQARDLGVYAFLVAMAITAFLSIGSNFHSLSTAHIEADFVFRNHIMTGMMMAFAAYLAGFLFFKQEKISAKIVYSSLAIIYSYQVLFINQGRMSYILLAVLLITLLVQMLNYRQAVLSVLLAILLLGVCYQLSPSMQSGITAVSNNIKNYQQDKNTSVGFRIQFHHYAKELLSRHPLIGNGTGSFSYYFKQENPVPGWKHRLLEPHSQYWLIAAEFGGLGLTIFTILWFNLLNAAWALQEWRSPAIALLLLITIGNLSDSLLFYSGSGYFFIVFMALFLGEQITTKVGSQKIA